MRSPASSTIGQLQPARTALAVSPKNSSSPGRWATPLHHHRRTAGHLPDNRLVGRSAGSDRGVDVYPVTSGEAGNVLEHGLLAPMRNGCRLAASGCALRDVENLDPRPVWTGQRQREIGGATRHFRAIDRNQDALCPL